MKLILQDGRPIAEANDDYTGPMEWINAPEGYVLGSFVLPGQDIPPPTSCTPAQGLIALYAIKQLTEQDILDAIAQIPDPVQRYSAQIGYTRATTWERTSATMQALAALLGLSESELDALFIYAGGVAL